MERFRGSGSILFPDPRTGGSCADPQGEIGTMFRSVVILAALLAACHGIAQTTNDPFPEPIAATEGVVRVRFVEFASIPDVGGQAARMMLLITEPTTSRLFVNDMRGPLYSITYDGNTVTQYIDINDDKWGVHVQSAGQERGFQSFAFHPDFGRTGAPGFGRFYTWTDTSNTAPAPDFNPGGGGNSHDTVLLEWKARTPDASTYDGGPPRELLRIEQPFANHNGGHLTFNPFAAPGDADFGLLYMGVADGGSGGDPLHLAQNLASPFGKILRLDPLGSNSANGRYGIPAGNPFAGDGDDRTLGEIYAYGVRNPQRLGWDPKNGNMFVADIGQNIVEELSPVRSGGNLGWSDWEGSFRFIRLALTGRNVVSLENPRSDANVIYPVVEYAHKDPLLQSQCAITGVYVYRSDAIPQLANRILFGDFPSGEIFWIPADDLPHGGQDAIHRVLLNDGGQSKTLLQVIQEKNGTQNRQRASRADLRFGSGPNGEVFLLNKHDGIIRLLVPGT